MRVVLLVLAAATAAVAGVRGLRDRPRLELVPLECPPGCGCRALAVLDEIERSQAA